MRVTVALRRRLPRREATTVTRPVSVVVNRARLDVTLARRANTRVPRLSSMRTAPRMPLRIRRIVRRAGVAAEVIDGAELVPPTTLGVPAEVLVVTGVVSGVAPPP